MWLFWRDHRCISIGTCTSEFYSAKNPKWPVCIQSRSTSILYSSANATVKKHLLWLFSSGNFEQLWDAWECQILHSMATGVIAFTVHSSHLFFSSRHQLIKALASIWQTLPGTPWRISAVERSCDRLLLGGCPFHGRVERDEIPTRESPPKQSGTLPCPALPFPPLPSTPLPSPPLHSLPSACLLLFISIHTVCEVGKLNWIPSAFLLLFISMHTVCEVGELNWIGPLSRLSRCDSETMAESPQ